MINQTIHAQFRNQEQAESAVRKLRALRGDCFRIECMGTASAENGLISSNVEFAAESDIEGEGAGLFSLSANIPHQAADQARSVIVEIGGQMMP